MKNAKAVVVLTVAVALMGLVAAEMAVAQDLHPSRRPSPMGMGRITVDDCYMRVVYSRPYKRGRDNIFGTEESGALVPFGKVWRTGANEATEITVTKDVEVAGQALPAGTYSLFTTPGPEEWQIHINSALGLSGTMRFNPETRQAEAGYDAANNVVNATVKAGTVDEEVDQLTIVFEKTGDDSADMVLRWINTEVRLPIKVTG